MKKLLIIIIMILSAVISRAGEPPKFLDPNKVWEYGYGYYNGDTSLSSLYRYQIDGTEEYNGKIYNVLWQTQEIQWNLIERVNHEPRYAVDTISDRKKIALLREEDNRIYMPYLGDGPVLFIEKNEGNVTIPRYDNKVEIDVDTWVENALWHLIPNNDEAYNNYFYITFQVEEFNETDEIMLFDFNEKEVGEKINFWGFSDRWVYLEPDYYYHVLLPYSPCIYEFTVNDIEKQCVNFENEEIETYTITSEFTPKNIMNKEYKYNTFAGSIGDEAFILGPKVTIVHIAFGEYIEFWFNNLYDKEGNVIFEGENIEAPQNNASVLNVEAETGQDARMYDVMGREISNPQPGTIYIQNGRKLIAR